MAQFVHERSSCVPKMRRLLTVMERYRLAGVGQTKGGGMAGKTDRRAFLKGSTSAAALGAFGGHLGGAPLGRAALRVTIGGALAMAVTAAIGRIVGVVIG